MEDQSKCSTTESISQNRNRLAIQTFHLALEFESGVWLFHAPL